MRRSLWSSCRSWIRRPLPVLVWLAGPLLAAAAERPPPTPNPALDPAAVVRIQLDALAHVDRPVRNAGLAIVFSFASPGNQAQTGPLDKFVGMIRRGYPDMLNHRSATLVKTKIDGDQALQGVEIIDRAGLAHHYVFILSRQHDAPFKDCWMTDGVIIAPGEKPKVET